MFHKNYVSGTHPYGWGWHNLHGCSKVAPVLNYEPHHEVMWGGGITPRILNLGSWHGTW